MKKKKFLAAAGPLILLALFIGIYRYQKNVQILEDLSLETSTNRSDNNLKTGYELLVKGDSLWIITNNKVPYKESKSSLQKQIDQTIAGHRFNSKSAFYGRKVKVIKKTAFFGKYTIATKKLRLFLTKQDDGSYKSQDGTVWLKTVD